MRTTLTLDADVARLLEEEAHRQRKPFKQVVNEAIRRGLSPQPSARPGRYRVRPHKTALRPGFDPGSFNKLADDLGIGERVRAKPFDAIEISVSGLLGRKEDD